jgi:hypothetical protein
MILKITKWIANMLNKLADALYKLSINTRQLSRSMTDKNYKIATRKVRANFSKFKQNFEISQISREILVDEYVKNKNLNLDDLDKGLNDINYRLW